MKNTKIYAYKHNGDFHRMWSESEVLQETKDYMVLNTKNNTRVIESTNHCWYTKEEAICYFSKKRWFNIIIMYKPNEVVYYCNLASPILLELDTLKYIDYDLDLKYFVNSKKIVILDKKEFAVNKFKYEYPEWLEEKVQQELKILTTWAKNEIGPFSAEFRDNWHSKMIEDENE